MKLKVSYYSQYTMCCSKTHIYWFKTRWLFNIKSWRGSFDDDKLYM